MVGVAGAGEQVGLGDGGADGKGVGVGGGACARIVTGAEVTAAPDPSVALAVRMVAPLTSSFHVVEYGAAVASPIFAGPAKNSTLAIPSSGSLAAAVIGTLAPTVMSKPSAGVMIVIVGGALTRIWIAEEVVAAPVLSVATAVMA